MDNEEEFKDENNIESCLNQIEFYNDYNLFENVYKCYCKIGEGGFGTVYKGYQISNNEKVIIKHVKIVKVPDMYFWKSKNIEIPMEVVLLAKCQHIKGVVKLFAIYQSKASDGWYLIMNRIEKYLDLFDYINKVKYLSENKAAYFLSQLVEIIKQCHLSGVLHRDIKDENIIVDLENDSIQIIDFGSGSFIQNKDFIKYDGTRVYSPPEWIRDKHYNGKKLEVWSLGILLFDMVCGDIPFTSDNEIIHSHIKYRTLISSDCRDLIQKCLTKDPSSRLSIDDILEHPWLQNTIWKNENYINTVFSDVLLRSLSGISNTIETNFAQVYPNKCHLNKSGISINAAVSSGYQSMNNSHEQSEHKIAKFYLLEDESTDSADEEPEQQTNNTSNIDPVNPVEEAPENLNLQTISGLQRNQKFYRFNQFEPCIV